MKLLIVIFIIVAISVGAKNKGDCTVNIKNCEYKGQKYDIGSSFTDECNTCTCHEGGKVACTLMLCQDQDPCSSVDCVEGKLCWVNESGIAECRDDPCTNVSCSVDKICTANRFDCTPECVKSSCEYNGETYYHGESFPCQDGCNQCSCSDGMVVCTLRACGGTCEYESNTYNEGDSFPCVDGCNTCSCSSGNVTCSEKTCDHTCDYEGDTYSEGDSFPSIDGCNTCSCSSGKVSCSENPCPKIPPTCNYEGSTYNEGDSFPCIDGCNNCSCSSGNVTCTTNTCETPITCGTNTDCASGFYCSKKSCDDSQGTCSFMPPSCVDLLIDPVCGCDNQSYVRPCLAAAAGVNVKSKGNC